MPVPFLSGTPSTGGGASGGGGAGGSWGLPSTPGEPGTVQPSNNPSGGFDMQPGATPYPLPNPSGNRPFTGGQCPGVSYLVSGAIQIPQNGTNPSFVNPFGPIRVAGPITQDERESGGGTNTAIGFTYGSTPLYYVLASARKATPPTWVSFDVVRADGQPDDCGDPPKLPERYTPPDSTPPIRDPQAPATPGPPGPPGPPGADGQDGADGEDGEPSRPIAPGPSAPVGGNPSGGTPGVGTPGGGGFGGGISGGGGASAPGQTIPPTAPNGEPETEPETEDCDPCAKIDDLMAELEKALLAEGSGSIPLPACPPPSPVEDSEDTTESTSVDE